LKVKNPVEMDVNIWNTLTIPTLFTMVGKIACKNRGDELLDSFKPALRRYSAIYGG
jgi:hypothetical protein